MCSLWPQVRLRCQAGDDVRGFRVYLPEVGHPVQPQPEEEQKHKEERFQQIFQVSHFGVVRRVLHFHERTESALFSLHPHPFPPSPPPKSVDLEMWMLGLSLADGVVLRKCS